MLSSKFRGSEEMRRKADRALIRFPLEAAAALQYEAEIEVTECKHRTPVKTGALRASEHAEPAEIRGSRISVTIVAGGPSAPYAIKVHEDLEAFHPVGQAKYIESTLTESAPFMGQRMAARIDLSRLA